MQWKLQILDGKYWSNSGQLRQVRPSFDSISLVCLLFQPSVPRLVVNVLA